MAAFLGHESGRVFDVRFSLIFSLGVLLMAHTLKSQIIVEDFFDEPTIDETKWININPHQNTILNDWRSHTVTSVTTYSDGAVKLANGASLSSAIPINQPYRFSGVFIQTSGLTGGGRPSITLRGTTDRLHSVYKAPAASINLYFHPFINATNKLDIAQWFDFADYENTWRPVVETYKNNDFYLSMDSPTEFVIEDWGNLLKVWINDVFVSEAVLSDSDFGGKVALTGAWYDYAGLKVDSLKIESIPEPHGIWSLSASFAVFLASRKRKKSV